MNAMISDTMDVNLADIAAYRVRNAVAEVSCREPYTVSPEIPSRRVVLLDYGTKQNIVRELVRRGCAVRVLPHTATAKEILSLAPDGVLLSNGPGDPADNQAEIATLAALAGKVPIFGICLGHQLLGLHAGAGVEVGPCIMHGKQSEVVHDGTGLFSGLPNPMKVGRYHSLVVRADEDAANPRFTVTARPRKARSWPCARKTSSACWPTPPWGRSANRAGAGPGHLAGHGRGALACV